jgi:hypothetical protein
MRSPSSPGQPGENSNRTGGLRRAWAAVRAELEGAWARLSEEIRNYPRPIPACDEQFNHLLEQRARLARDMDGLEEASGQGLGGAGALERAEAFIRSTSYLDDAARQRFLTALRSVRSGPDS